MFTLKISLNDSTNVEWLRLCDVLFSSGESKIDVSINGVIIDDPVRWMYERWVDDLEGGDKFKFKFYSN